MCCGKPEWMSEDGYDGYLSKHVERRKNESWSFHECEDRRHFDRWADDCYYKEPRTRSQENAEHLGCCNSCCCMSRKLRRRSGGYGSGWWEAATLAASVVCHGATMGMSVFDSHHGNWFRVPTIRKCSGSETMMGQGQAPSDEVAVVPEPVSEEMASVVLRHSTTRLNRRCSELTST